MFSRQGYADPIEMTDDGYFIQAPRTSTGFDTAAASGLRACKASHLYSKNGATAGFRYVDLSDKNELSLTLRGEGNGSLSQ